MRPGDTVVVVSVSSPYGHGHTNHHTDRIKFESFSDTHINGVSEGGTSIGIPLVFVTEILRTATPHVEGCSYPECFDGNVCAAGT